MRLRQGQCLGTEFRVRRGGLAAEDPQARVGSGPKAGHVTVDHQVVLPVAEKGEVVLDRPGEECPHLLELAGVDPGRGNRELVDQPLHRGEHRLPVLDRAAHVLEDALDVGLQAVELAGVGLAGDLDVHDRFAHGVVALAAVLEYVG